MEARAKTNRGEKSVLERGLERRVEAEQLRAGAVRDRHGDRDEEPADDRRWDVEAREHWNRTPQPVAGKENNPSYRDGIDEIEGKHLDQSGRPTEARPPRRAGDYHTPSGAPVRDRRRPSRRRA